MRPAAAPGRWLEYLGGRKYSLAVLVQVCTTALVACARLDGGAYVAVTLGVAAIYVGGNVTQRVRAGGSEPTPQPEAGQ